MKQLLITRNALKLKIRFFLVTIFLTTNTMIMAQQAPDYSIDQHLSPAVKTFLRPLNAGGPPVESLSKQDARNVLTGAQASVNVDLSGLSAISSTRKIS